MRRIRSQSFALAAAACAAGIAGTIAGVRPAPAETGQSPAASLRAPESFAGVADPNERARQIFLEASRVLLHPRCRNCHPDSDSPAQGDSGRVHDPPVTRGPQDQGVPGLECTSCHQERNQALARVPGAPKWHLAPRAMAWVGRSPQAICEQMKNPARNGGKSLAQIVEHAAHDELVAWGWAPGSGRTPAPGTQERFAALIAAWVKDGAACPREGAKP